MKIDEKFIEIKESKENFRELFWGNEPELSKPTFKNVKTKEKCKKIISKRLKNIEIPYFEKTRDEFSLYIVKDTLNHRGLTEREFKAQRDSILGLLDETWYKKESEKKELEYKLKKREEKDRRKKFIFETKEEFEKEGFEVDEERAYRTMNCGDYTEVFGYKFEFQ
jgi:hypothetical protein